jgi:hypothetical protein
MQSLKRCTLSWPTWLRPSVASGSSLPTNARHIFANDGLCAAREGVAKAMRESISTIVFISLSWFLRSVERDCGRLSPQAITPILKKVSPELLAITDPAVRIREPGLVPIDEEFRLGDRQEFARGSPADHVDARARYSKSSHRSHEQSRRAVCPDRLHPQGM